MAKSDATLRVTYRVNLKELFGKEFPDNESLKKRIGEEIIARIQTRTQRGIDKNGKGFKGYSKSYKEQTGKGNPPDLVLKGDMQGNMKVVKTTKNTVTIGFGRAKQRLKAENHIHGVTLPKRDFLGLPQVELDQIASEFDGDIE